MAAITAIRIAPLDQSTFSHSDEILLGFRAVLLGVCSLYCLCSIVVPRTFLGPRCLSAAINNDFIFVIFQKFRHISNKFVKKNLIL